MSLRDHCCAKQSFFEESEETFQVGIYAEVFKVAAQTHGKQALAIGTIALNFSHVWMSLFCNMLSHNQHESAAVHLSELMVPDSFIHTQCKVELMWKR